MTDFLTPDEQRLIALGRKLSPLIPKELGGTYEPGNIPEPGGLPAPGEIPVSRGEPKPGGIRPGPDTGHTPSSKSEYDTRAMAQTTTIQIVWEPWDRYAIQEPALVRAMITKALALKFLRSEILDGAILVTRVDDWDIDLDIGIIKHRRG